MRRRGDIPSDEAGGAPRLQDEARARALEAELAREAQEAELARQAIEREERRKILEGRYSAARAKQKDIEDAAIDRAVSAILMGQARIEGIDPRIVSHPRALEALRLARTLQDILLRSRMDDACTAALDHLLATMNNPAASERARLAAANAIIGARAKMGSPTSDGLEAARAALANTEASTDLSSLSDAELEKRTRDLLTRIDGA